MSAVKRMTAGVCDLLGIKYPVIQGGMAWVAEHNLAAAVSNAGGLGIIAAANADYDIVKNEIRKTKALTDKPFGVNIMLISPNADDIARLVIEEDIKIVTTGAGTPGKYIGAWKDAGIAVIPVVASVAMAKRMEKGGADAVIAEGCEAGGHIGEATSMTLIPQIADAIKIPLIAAGGIGDGRGFAAAMMLGASGVQIGTRFIVAHESIVHKNYKQKVISSRDIDSTVTGRSTGHPVRTIRNRMTRDYLKLEKEGRSFEELELLTLGALRKAVLEGDVSGGSLMAGQIAGLVSKEQSAKDIIEEIIMQADALLSAAGGCQ